MRISTQVMQNLAVEAMQDQQSKLSKTQLQLASGRRILAPSDDPSASSLAVSMRENLARIDTYTDNITQARSRLETEENVLRNISDALQRVRELTLQGANASQPDETRASIAGEIRQRLEQIVDLANTRGANNEYIFGGYRSQTEPVQYDNAGSYSYAGDSGQRFVQISPTRQVAVSDPGLDVFFGVRDGNGVFATSADTGNNGSGVIDPGSVLDKATYRSNLDSYDIVFPVASNAAVPMSFNDQTGTDDTLQYTLSINGQVVYQVDETGTPAATLDELAAVINDDTATTGVRALVDNGVLYLANTPASQDDITISESMTGNTAGDGDSITGYFGNTLTESASSATRTVAVTGQGDRYLVVDSGNTVVESGDYVSGATIQFAGIQTRISGEPARGDTFNVDPSRNRDLFGIVQNIAEYLEGKANSDTEFANAMNQGLSNLDRALGNIIEYTTRVGSRMQTLDAQEESNADYRLQMESTLSRLEDLDIVEATAQMNLQLVGLQAAQQSFIRIQNLSLFNFLG